MDLRFHLDMTQRDASFVTFSLINTDFLFAKHLNPTFYHTAFLFTFYYSNMQNLQLFVNLKKLLNY